MRPARFLPIILLCLAAGSASAQGFQLGLRRIYPFGTQSHGPTFFDLNSDGRLDGLVANTSVDSVTIRFGDGFGNFGPATRLLTGDAPLALALGDLSGDFLPELVVANQGGSVSVFLGVSGGTYLSSSKLDFPTDDSPTSLAIGDVTGDGRLDVVTANPGEHSVTVLTGGAPGTGLTGETQTLATGQAPTAVVLGDVDGDGMTDILTANSNGLAVSVIRGQTSGGFAPKVDYTTAAGPRFLRLGDVDNDGDLDLVTLNFTGTLSLLLNNGAGAFPSHDDMTVTTQATGFELSDLDGDGIADVAFPTAGAQGITVLRGSGFSFYNPESFPVTQGANFDLTVADLNHDGRRDIVAAGQTGMLVAYFGARGPFGDHQDFAAGSFPIDVAVADLNGDTFPDIASANFSSANASVLLNAGDGTFPAHTEYATTSFPSLVRLGDIDADGDRELVVGTFSGLLPDTNRVLVFPNLGNGTFGPRRQFDPITQDGIRGMALGNINGDAYLDLVDTHYNDNSMRLWLGDATGGFSPWLPPFMTFLHPAGVGLVDVDADSALDIVLPAFGAHAISCYLGDGAGNFASPLNFITNSEGPVEFASGDLDGDGDLDLAVLNLTARSISLMLGNGAGVFSLQAVLNAGAIRGIGIRDLNRDGIADLVYGTGETVLTRYGMGGGALGAPVGAFTFGQLYGLALEDLDQNGTVDGVTGIDPGSVAVLYGLQQTRTVLTVAPNPAALNSMLTLSATVTPLNPDPSAPTGTVRFFDGLTLLGSAPIVNGVATLQHAASLPWNRTFSAEYLGDFRFHGGFSGPVPQVTYIPNVAVEPGPASRLSLAPARQPSRAGELSLRFTLPGSGAAELALFDVRGRLIHSLDVGDRGAGTHTASLGNGLRPGVYLVRLVQGAQAVTTRAVVL